MLTPSAKKPELRIAIYRASSLGDVVLASACLDLLSQLSIPKQITWIGRGAALELLAKSWPELRTIAVEKGAGLPELGRVVTELQSNHLFVDLQSNLRSQWLARNLKAIHRVPYFVADKAQLARNRLLFEARVRGRRRPLPDRAQQASTFQYNMMADAVRRALRFQLPVELREGLDTLSCRPRLPIPLDFDPPWRKELRFGSWLAVAPGAAHPTKQAPVESLVSILDIVRNSAQSRGGLASPPIGLAFFGDNKDRQVARKILDAIGWDGPVLNLAGKLSLWESAVALSEARCLLSNDSSLSHIAEAVDTPATVLFGPTVEAFGFAPRSASSRAFSSPVGCRPCSKHGKVSCRFGDRLCFSTLQLAPVADHLLQFLATEPESETTKDKAFFELRGTANPQDNGYLNS